MSVVVSIADDPDALEGLRRAVGKPGPDIVAPALSGRHGDVDRIVETLPATDDVAVIIGPGLTAERSLELLETIDRIRPDVVKLLAAPLDPAILQRALSLGIRGIIAPGATDVDLAATVRDATEFLVRRREVIAGAEPSGSDRRILSVISAKGGTGKTTIAANIAVALAIAAPGQVALVDFDLQFGDVEYALRLKPEATIADLGRAGSRIDSTSMKAYLTPHPCGVFALCGPTRPAEAEELDSEMLGKVIELLSNEFRYVVIDTAGGIDDRALVAMDHTTDVILMSSTDIPSVRAMQKTIEALTSLGLDKRRWHYVLNRSDAKVGLTADDIREAVGLDIDLAVPESKSMTLAMNQGSPVVESDPRSAAAKAIASFVERFLPELEEQAAVDASKRRKRVR